MRQTEVPTRFSVSSIESDCLVKVVETTIRFNQSTGHKTDLCLTDVEYKPVSQSSTTNVLTRSSFVLVSLFGQHLSGDRRRNSGRIIVTNARCCSSRRCRCCRCCVCSHSAPAGRVARPCSFIAQKQLAVAPSVKGNTIIKHGTPLSSLSGQTETF